MSQSSRRPRREFRPGSHATIYLLALVYLGYLLFQLIRNFLQGGESAPEPLHLILGILVLGGGMAILGFMAWRMTHLPPKEEEEPERKPEEKPAPRTLAERAACRPPEPEDSEGAEGSGEAEDSGTAEGSGEAEDSEEAEGSEDREKSENTGEK